MDLKNVIFELTSVCGVSGEESDAAETALGFLRNYTDDCFIKKGCVIGNFGKRESGKPHILLDAHIDQVGFVVTDICENGFVHFSNAGGIDRRLLPAQQVCIYGKEKVTGVICSTPPHLSSSDDTVPEGHPAGSAPETEWTHPMRKPARHRQSAGDAGPTPGQFRFSDAGRRRTDGDTAAGIPQGCQPPASALPHCAASPSYWRRPYG